MSTPDVAVVGDLAETLPALLPLVEERRHQIWVQELKEWREDSEETDIINFEVDELIPPYVIRQLWHATKDAKDGAIIVTDVGQHQMWECQYYIHNHAGQLLTSGGLGTMGYALPAAIGAQMAQPGSSGLGRGRRRRLPDDLAGAWPSSAGEAAGQDRHHQQWLPGHGAPVAAALLRETLHGYADSLARLSLSWPRPMEFLA
jgi:hypothetical protein